MHETSFGLEREGFSLDMVGDLAEVMQTVVGSAGARDVVRLVGQRMGDRIRRLYAQAGVTPSTPDAVARVLVDLKRHIGGEFSIASADDARIVLHNTRCPFEERAEGREALCQMTSAVFGRIAADSLGHARVTLDETLARGDGRCVVKVHLVPDPDAPGATYWSDAT